MFSTIVIGGGAAGFFAAIKAAEFGKVLLLERTNQILSKVRISGGGRCNVTHACFEPMQLVKNYPRGQKELLGPFTRFQPKDTMEWFETRGVALKVEGDGRVFPVSNSSQTIIDCLVNEAKKGGVELRLQCHIDKVIAKNPFEIHLTNGEILTCTKLILATGSNPHGHALAHSLGHSIIAPVPSLFTFNVPTSPLLDLSGLSTTVEIKLSNLKERGPLLITHFGFSGPAVLRLSAWGARIFHEKEYKTEIVINWVPDRQPETTLLQWKEKQPNFSIGNENPFQLPRKLWKRFLELNDIETHKKWGEIPKQQLQKLSNYLQSSIYKIEGKTTHKEEFVTCGGVALKEVNFKTMGSRLCAHLYFAGEILDIDGITGGFNFQNAWTTGFIAGNIEK